MAHSLHTASLAFTPDNDNGNDDDGVASSLEELTLPYFIHRALSSTLLDAEFFPPNCAQRCSALACQSSHETPPQSPHRKCHPPTPYVHQGLDYAHGCRLNTLLLGFRSEESLSSWATVSCPRSLSDHVLTVNYRCLRQDFAAMFVCPRRVSQRICESSTPSLTSFRSSSPKEPSQSTPSFPSPDHSESPECSHF